MDIANKEEIDSFLWDHLDNGCIGVKGDLLDEEGLKINVAWRDVVTGEEMEIKYNGL